MRGADYAGLLGDDGAAQFGAGLHHAQNRVARDHADDLRVIFALDADHRHLIDVGGEQALEQAQKRFFGGGPGDALAGNHDRLNGIGGPLVARHGVQRLHVHHAHQAIFGDHQVDAAAGP